MRNFLRLSAILLLMTFVQTSQAQTYCEYLFGFAWCGTGWEIDDITIGSFSQLNSGCNSGPYNNASATTTITVSKGTPIPFTLGSGGTAVQWAIWVDLNKDGDFTDATDFFWGSSTPSASVSGTMLIPASVSVSNTRIRIASRNQSLAIVKSDACNFGYQAETQDFDLLMLAAGGCNIPTTMNAFATSNSALLSWDSTGTQYNVEWGLTGYTQGLGTTLNPTTDTISISGLSANTYYDYYVQNDCSSSTGDSSSWNGPFTFTTECVSVTMFPYFEGFEDADWTANTGFNYTDDTISTCWDRYPIYNWNYAWLVRTGSTPSTSTGPNSAYSGLNYMYVETNGSAGDEAIFTSPQFNISTLNTPWLSYYYHMYGSVTGKLYTEVSTDGGFNWTTVDSIIGEQQISDLSAWLERGLDVTAYKGTNFMFRLKAKHKGGFGLGDIAVDHFGLAEAPACRKVSNFLLSNITGTSVDVSWTSNSSLFYMEIIPTGFSQGTGNIDTVSSGMSNTFSGLAGDTYYDVYIQTDCSANSNGTSAWAGPYTFRTLIRPTWLEDFTVGFVPNNRWFEAQGAIDNPTSFTSAYSSWSKDGWLNNGFDGAVKCNINTWGGTVDEWFFTELIDLGTGTNWELHFDMAATVGNATGPVSLESDDTIKVVISTDGGLTWNNSNTIFTITQSTNLNNLGSTFTVDLNGYTGVVKIGFYCESTVANTTSIDVFLDNLGIRLPAACPSPTAMNVWNVNASDLVFGWSGSSSASSYDVEYGAKGFIQGTGTTISGITADSVLVTGLTGVTEYDFYVTANCSTGTSVSAGPMTVLTGCPVVFATPYSSNFDVLSAGNPPAGGHWINCWETDNATGSFKYRWQSSKGASTWSNTGPSADHTQGVAGEGTYMYTEASYTGLEATMVNGPFDLSSLTSPILSFWYHMYGADMGELHVDVTTDLNQWNNDVFVLKGQEQTATSDPWSYTKLALSQYVNDTIYIRFRGVRGFGFNGDMAIDDVSIKETVGCISPSGLLNTGRTTTTADLAWGSYSSSHTIEWGPLGFTQGSGTGTVVSGLSATNHTVTGLTANSGYDFYVKDTCNINTWVGPFTFYTDCSGPLSGTYTIGGTPGAANFTTIEQAISALNNCGVSAAVTFNLMGVTHTTTPLTISEISGASATNSVTFNGSGSDTILVNSDHSIQFNQAGYVTLNNIYIANNSGKLAIWLHNGSHDISITNCTIQGVGGSSPSFSSACIAASSVGYQSGSSGQNSFNINISGNTFYNSYSAISIYGESQNPTHGLSIVDNVFEDVYSNGIYVNGVDSVYIQDNYMHKNTYIYGGRGAYLSNVNEFEVSGNYFAVNGSGLYASNCNTDSVSQNSNIINNMFVGLNSGDGIYISNSNRMNIYNNSCYGGSNGFYLAGWTTGDHYNIRNNIFVGVGDKAFYNSAPGTNFTYDYNIYYTYGTDFVYDANTNHASLTAWKVSVPSQNANSVEGDPGYTTNEDLHIIGVLPNDIGDNTVGVIVDIDGDTRPASGSTTIDIGADEFTPKGNDVSVVRVLSPVVGCGDSIADVQVLIRNYGSTLVTSVAVTANVTGDINTVLNATYTGNLPSLAYDTVNMGSINTYYGGQNVIIESYSSLLNDEDASNDTTIHGPIYFIPHVPTYYAADTICNNPLDSATQSAVSYNGVNYAWYANATDSIPVALGDSFTYSLAGQKDWYLGYQDGIRDSLTTIGFLSQYGGLGGVMFDITAKTNIEIDGFELNSRVNVGDTGTFIIHYIAYGTFKGNETSPAKWSTHETVSYVGAGTQNKSMVTLSNPLSISVGSTYAIYLEYNAAWTNANPLNELQNTPLLTFAAGTGLYGSFSSTSINRVFDGVIGARSVVCSNAKVKVSTQLNADTASANFIHTVSLPNKVDVDATSSTGHVISWDFGDGNTANGDIATHTYTSGGNYTVTCIVVDTVCNTVDTMTTMVNMTIGMDESLLAQSLTVFPNPNDGTFKVAFDIEGSKNVKLKVIDAVGRAVYFNDLGSVDGSYQAEVNLSSSSHGLYIIQIITDDNVVNKKITVQ